MTSGTTIVLGWDGLDYDLVHEFGLTRAFGPTCKEIDSIDNPALGKPHTYELWPTLITGLRPDEHGIRSHNNETKSAAWEARWLRVAARVASHVVPQDVRSRIGQHLRSRGMELNFRTPAYYEARGIETVFDGRASRPIAIPNYHTVADERLGVVMDRGAEMAHLLDDLTADDETDDARDAPVARYEEQLAAEAAEKIGIVRSALDRDYDLVWVWMGYLDSAGHLDPATDVSLQRRAYEQAAELTALVRDEMAQKDELLCVSDHGLQDGEHTHTAMIGGSRPEVEEVGSVSDVAGFVDEVTPASGSNHQAPLRIEGDEQTTRPDAIKQNLADLGYIEGD